MSGSSWLSATRPQTAQRLPWNMQLQRTHCSLRLVQFCSHGASNRYSMIGRKCSTPVWKRQHDSPFGWTFQRLITILIVRPFAFMVVGTVFFPDPTLHMEVMLKSDCTSSSIVLITRVGGGLGIGMTFEKSPSPPPLAEAPAAGAPAALSASSVATAFGSSVGSWSSEGRTVSWASSSPSGSDIFFLASRVSLDLVLFRMKANLLKVEGRSFSMRMPMRYLQSIRPRATTTKCTSLALCSR
mmetsp:Transcript_129917/g.416934  ORF Transcript_129917/g.416934 Transcript_129917/m.416934 type:complete len:241 (+) Transcript_129917:123-845(+)